MTRPHVKDFIMDRSDMDNAFKALRTLLETGDAALDLVVSEFEAAFERFLIERSFVLYNASMKLKDDPEYRKYLLSK